MIRWIVRPSGPSLVHLLRTPARPAAEGRIAYRSPSPPRRTVFGAASKIGGQPAAGCSHDATPGPQSSPCVNRTGKRGLLGREVRDPPISNQDPAGGVERLVGAIVLADIPLRPMPRPVSHRRSRHTTLAVSAACPGGSRFVGRDLLQISTRPNGGPRLVPLNHPVIWWINGNDEPELSEC